MASRDPTVSASLPLTPLWAFPPVSVSSPLAINTPSLPVVSSSLTAVVSSSFTAIVFA